MLWLTWRYDAPPTLAGGTAVILGRTGKNFGAGAHGCSAFWWRSYPQPIAMTSLSVPCLPLGVHKSPTATACLPSPVHHSTTGMSGGVAYVYDPERRFAPLCNVDVAQDLFPVESGQVRLGAGWAGMAVESGRFVAWACRLLKWTTNANPCPAIKPASLLPCLLQDLMHLRSLVQRHVKYTNSTVGRRILLDWDAEHKHFVKVGLRVV